MKHLSDMDVEKFKKLECEAFDREIFVKLFKCELNLFYEISKFKNYDQQKFITALKKRKILFRDIEFSEDRKFFRRVSQREETLDEINDKALEFARNMYFVHELHDDLEEKMSNDPVLQAQIEKNIPKWKKYKQ